VIPLRSRRVVSSPSETASRGGDQETDAASIVIQEGARHLQRPVFSPGLAIDVRLPSGERDRPRRRKEEAEHTTSRGTFPLRGRTTPARARRASNGAWPVPIENKPPPNMQPEAARNFGHARRHLSVADTSCSWTATGKKRPGVDGTSVQRADLNGCGAPLYGPASSGYGASFAEGRTARGNRRHGVSHSPQRVRQMMASGKHRRHPRNGSRTVGTNPPELGDNPADAGEGGFRR